MASARGRWRRWLPLVVCALSRAGLGSTKRGNLFIGRPSLSRVPRVGLWNATGERLPPLFPSLDAWTQGGTGICVVPRSLDERGNGRGRRFSAAFVLLGRVGAAATEISWSR